MRLPILCLLTLPLLSQAAAPPLPGAAPPVEVMVVGVFHLSNPGHDLHNMQVDDVLAPRRQAELAAISTGLRRFRPTRVVAEWPAGTVAERYPQYLAGTLAPSTNEVVQLGFRLAKDAGGTPVHGIDVDGDFPYDPVKAWAQAHGRMALLDEQNARFDRMDAAQEKMLATHGIAAVLRDLNGPHGMSRDNDFYRTALRMGEGAEQPGVALLDAWYRRNFLICANLLQLAAPGDRIVVFYGAGHAFLLRQCVAETPGFRLVEPNGYLPAR